MQHSTLPPSCFPRQCCLKLFHKWLGNIELPWTETDLDDCWHLVASKQKLMLLGRNGKMTPLDKIRHDASRNCWVVPSSQHHPSRWVWTQLRQDIADKERKRGKRVPSLLVQRIPMAGNSMVPSYGSLISVPLFHYPLVTWQWNISADFPIG